MKKKPLPDYARFSGLGLQMVAFVLICAFAGKYADSFKLTTFPLFTVIGIFIGAFGAMYYMIKQLK
ncbi:MAG TPA: AtpZ/AtpI family protein [Bacteroidia bacterium]